MGMYCNRCNKQTGSLKSFPNEGMLCPSCYEYRGGDEAVKRYEQAKEEREWKIKNGICPHCGGSL